MRHPSVSATCANAHLEGHAGPWWSVSPGSWSARLSPGAFAGAGQEAAPFPPRPHPQSPLPPTSRGSTGTPTLTGGLAEHSGRRDSLLLQQRACPSTGRGEGTAATGTVPTRSAGRTPSLPGGGALNRSARVGAAGTPGSSSGFLSPVGQIQGARRPHRPLGPSRGASGSWALPTRSGLSVSVCSSPFRPEVLEGFSSATSQAVFQLSRL